jgi:hypothetical protein
MGKSVSSYVTTTYDATSRNDCVLSRLTFSNSTFCPHSVFMCSVWISEQTAIIYLYSINWLVFITETECVYCAVRAGPLHTIGINFSLQIGGPGLIPGQSMWDLCCTKWHGNTFLSRVLQFSPVTIIPPTLHTHLHLQVALTRRKKGRTLGNFQKAMLFSKWGSSG